MKLNEQSRLLELKEERINELECKNREILKSKSSLQELSENWKQEFDKTARENEEIKNELNKLKEIVNKVQMIVKVEETTNDQKSDDGLKIGPEDFHIIDIAVSQVVEERDHLRKENGELKQRLNFDAKMSKERTEMVEEENSVFQQKIIELEKNMEDLKKGIDVRAEERAEFQKNFDEMKVVVAEENVRVMLEERLEEITTEKDDMRKQLEKMTQKCDGLNAKLGDEIILRKKVTEKLEEITAEKDDMGKQLEDWMQQFNRLNAKLEEEITLRGKATEKLQEITAENVDMGKQLEALVQTCEGLNAKLHEEITLREKITEKSEEITAENVDIEKQLEAVVQTCHGLNAKLDEETILREEMEERLEKITAERNEMITNLAEEMKIKGQVEKSLDELTTEKNELVVKKIELYKNYVNEKNKRFEIEDELVKAKDLIEELRVPKLNCLQALIPCCFRRRR